MQEEQRATTPGDRTWIVRFTIGKQIEVITLHFTHHRRRIFSALLPPALAAIALRWLSHGLTSEVFLR
jgi:hypothetical protein